MSNAEQGMLQKAWSILTQSEDKPSQVALAICVIVVAGFLGCIAAFIYGFTTRVGDLFDHFASGFVAVLACLGAFSVGGMLGLLFGSPTLGNGQAVASDAEASGTQLGVRPNTSLERVAEWLTTMIVGLGLVNLGAIKAEATSMSVWLTEAISGRASLNGTPGITIALGFAFAGFLLLYLWCMRFLPGELRHSYEALKARAKSAEERYASLVNQFKEQANFIVPKAKLDHLSKMLTNAGVEPEVAADVVGRYTISTKADHEPMFEFGPNEAQGYHLSATVEDAGAGKFSVLVHLATPQDAAADQVFWLLHNSYTPDVVSVCPVDKKNGATYSTTVDEAFWIGAIVFIPGSATIRLALSLASVPDAPPGFVASQ